MYKGFEIKKPFFEFGPKVYLYGDNSVDMAVYADKLSEKYEVDIIFSAQYTDIERISKKTKNIKIFAQHMDPICSGRGIGGVLAEALKYSGAKGVLLNHAERQVSLSVLNATIKRADEAGLATLVCAGSIEESAAVACLKPNIIIAESPELIGVGKRDEKDMDEIAGINSAVKNIDKDILVLHGAGISDENDVYRIILAGADATGSTSGIINAADPKQMFQNMIIAVNEAYHERTGKRRA
ncbi:MAG: triose-phosphate isomerase [Synergistaceae bacterium]|jgi:triosephosphate isomerase|nr:triose-phosphate isomerase [Synergistaceae bacterium]